jgi:hypothetical protein
MPGTYRGGSTLVPGKWEKRGKKLEQRKKAKPLKAAENPRRSAAAKKAATTRLLNRAKREMEAANWNRANPRRGRFS